MIYPGSVLKPLVRIGKTPEACWSWLGAIDKNGVALKAHEGKMMPARRWMWFVLFGPLPDDIKVTTSCGSKQCTNPHCLRAGFQSEICQGTTQTVLLPADVLEIKAAKKHKSPNVARSFADRFGVTPLSIYAVWAGRTWDSAKSTRRDARA